MWEGGHIVYTTDQRWQNKWRRKAKKGQTLLFQLGFKIQGWLAALCD